MTIVTLTTDFLFTQLSSSSFGFVPELTMLCKQRFKRSDSASRQFVSVRKTLQSWVQVEGDRFSRKL